MAALEPALSEAKGRRTWHFEIHKDQKVSRAWNSITRPASPASAWPNVPLSKWVALVSNKNGCGLSWLKALKKLARTSTLAASPRYFRSERPKALARLKSFPQ